MCEKGYTWDSAICSYENGEFVRSIIDNSLITFDKIKEDTKSVPTNFNNKKVTNRTEKILYFTSLFIVYYSIIDSCYPPGKITFLRLPEDDVPIWSYM